MTTLARLASAAWAATLPVLVLAQQSAAPDRPGGNRSAWNWLWLVAAIVIVVALARVFFGRERRRAGPPAGRV